MAMLTTIVNYGYKCISKSLSPKLLVVIFSLNITNLKYRLSLKKQKNKKTLYILNSLVPNISAKG